LKNDRVLSLIGIAAKAGRIVSGEYAVDKEGKAGNACLVIIAGDAGERTRKSVQDMCAYYHIACEIYGTKEALGHAIGKEYRSQIAVLDTGLAENIQNNIRRSQEEQTWPK